MVQRQKDRQKGLCCFLFLIVLSVVCLISLTLLPGLDKIQPRQTNVSAAGTDTDTVLLGGMPVGIYMETDGVMVLSTETVEGVDGGLYEPAENLVKTGDYITAVNDRRQGRSFGCRGENGG